ncbi:protein pitchfork isoform X3 [Silurus meridionalis]|uniref:protein pitchfork isoform X3 n=1 Tax=Silurus meridionalis TaxID=175797 RepID=UPI001EEB6650|nr:protein pitchfork isoform X3 [Silurus meridionalis]
MAARNKVTTVAFGSCQDRKIFPVHRTPNRMGIEDLTLESLPTPGPGSYDNHVTVTPSPQEYQQDWSGSEKCAPGRTAFNSTAQRFTSKSTTISSNPGPGTYSPGGPCNRKVSWPMKFGSPDWSSVPMQKKKGLRTELPCDKELRKHRNRVAYLRLYYS